MLLNFLYVFMISTAVFFVYDSIRISYVSRGYRKALDEARNPNELRELGIKGAPVKIVSTKYWYLWDYRKILERIRNDN